MKFILLVLVASISAYAQDITTSRRGSYYTFVYKLTNAEAEALYKNNRPTQAFCHSLYTLYPSDSAKFQDALPVGHYLEVKTVADKLHYELVSINNVSIHILTNQRDLILVVSDSAGRRVDNAQVKIRNHSIGYDDDENAYVDQKSNRHGLLTVQVDGHTAYFHIERQKNNTFFVRTGKKILGTFPVNHLASIVIYPFKTVKNLVKGYGVSAPGIYYRAKRLFEPRYEKAWSGYIVFNKPLFRPNDTLKVKAFFANKRGKPISKPLDLRLYDFGPNHVNVKLGSITPYRAGGYVFETVLTDSLKLSLDTNPHLAFEYRNKTVDSKSFRYEQYELKSNQFLARSENKRTDKGAVLFLKGTDSNDLPLYDVHAEVLLTPTRVNHVYDHRLFVPDTLWFHKTRLDVVGETKITVPDSIFPPADISYKAVVAFLNADNERQVKELPLYYTCKQPVVRFEVKQDSIWLLPETPLDSTQLTAKGAENEVLYTKKVHLPYRETINPFVKQYEVALSPGGVFLDMTGYDDLAVLSNRTRDSVSITINNPRKIPFHYQVFKNRMLVSRGSGHTSTVVYNRQAGTRELFTISVQYVWAGVSKQESYGVDFNDRQLHVSIQHAPLIYPGQTTEFTIRVADANGNPVRNADVTSLAYTKKFKQSTAAYVPTYPRKQKHRLFFNAFRRETIQNAHVTKLNWLEWHQMLGLDSISFYQFLYPVTGKFEFEKSHADSITQIAPFLVENGLVLQPTVIYIDQKPVFHTSSQTVQPYSFRVSEGRHYVRMRLRNYSISFPVVVKKNHKQILSIDLNKLPADALKIIATKSDQEREIKTLGKYFIAVDRFENQAHAYIAQHNNYLLFNVSGARNSFNAETVGPLHPQLTEFVTADSTLVRFNVEPFYLYQFSPGLVKQRSFTSSLLSSPAYAKSFHPSFDDRVLTKSEIERRWAEAASSFSAIKNPRFLRYPLDEYVAKQTGRLSLAIMPSSTPKTHLATFFINLDNPDQYAIYPAHTLSFDKLGAASYEVVLLMADGYYLRSGTFSLPPFGHTYLNLTLDSLQAQDAFSEKLHHTLKAWDDKTTYVEQQRRIEMNEIRTSYYQQSTAPYSGHPVRGWVHSAEDGSPLPGVNVIVKGTTYGTVTDAAGEYYLTVPPGGELVFSFIGFTTEQEIVGARTEVNVEISSDVTQLNEVVVTGFGAQRKMSLTSAVSVVESRLLGRLPGVQTAGSPGATNQRIYLRGVGTLDAGSTPLIVLDGKIIDANTYRNLNPNSITAIEVLKDESAVAIYGSRAVGGVIVLSSRQGITTQQLLAAPLPEVTPIGMPTDALPGTSIRKNFRDYAFWKPQLITDKNGDAKFTTTFPDDVTGWKIEALAVASKKRSGSATSHVLSYKPLLAQLVVPSFLIEGDTALGIGKITNYTNDTLTITRTLAVAETVTGGTLDLVHSQIDSVFLSAGTKDSLQVTYTVKHNAYEDGEIRSFPVFRKGVKDADGFWLALRSDTTMTIAPQPGRFHLHAQTDLLDILLDEIETVKIYPYDCNEQLASKLRVLLAERKIAEVRKIKFKHDERIKRLVKRLCENQHEAGGWGWWNQSEGLMWITLHVVQGLEMAEKEGFETRYDKDGVLEFVQSQLFPLPLREQVLPMQFLLTHNIQVDVQSLYDSLVKTELSVYSRLRLAELMQHAKLPYNKKWLTDTRQESLKGNYYWGVDALQLFDNNIMSTLIAYRLRKHENAKDEELQRIRNFFLEKRSRSWRNTYESTAIIETLLPDLIKLTDTTIQPELIVNNKKVNQFPYDTILQTAEPIIIKKSGLAPVYFTAYRQFWNEAPRRTEADFVVNSSFNNNHSYLSVGKPVTLTVELVVKKDAEYVMLNVPIPAGCTYEHKNQSRQSGEIHRQYDYHQTTIFCASLRAGTYYYTISLVPRFTGTYTLNPARAEWMYFPTVYGQETIRKMFIH